MNVVICFFFLQLVSLRLPCLSLLYYFFFSFNKKLKLKNKELKSHKCFNKANGLCKIRTIHNMKLYKTIKKICLSHYHLFAIFMFNNISLMPAIFSFFFLKSTTILLVLVSSIAGSFFLHFFLLRLVRCLNSFLCFRIKTTNILFCSHCKTYGVARCYSIAQISSFNRFLICYCNYVLWLLIKYTCNT